MGCVIWVARKKEESSRAPPCFREHTQTDDDGKQVYRSHHLCCFRVRLEVQTCTSWKAPIIWEGMFNPTLYDQTHVKHGSSVAVTVFAVGRFVPLPGWKRFRPGGQMEPRPQNAQLTTILMSNLSLFGVLKGTWRLISKPFSLRRRRSSCWDYRWRITCSRTCRRWSPKYSWVLREGWKW